MEALARLGCRVCRGPVLGGLALCFQCDLARTQAAGLLADVVVPIGYAIKGGQLADDLRRYKSERADAADAARRLRAMLTGFLRDHGPCVWRAAAMSARACTVAVVPSGQGRPGAHPLLDLVRPCVDLPATTLVTDQREAVHRRGVSVGWLRVSGRLAARDVLLIDDTWVSGGSAQSAAAALKRAGAAQVAIVVLGRHLDPGDPRSAGLLRALRSAPPPSGTCGLANCGARATPRAVSRRGLSFLRPDPGSPG